MKKLIVLVFSIVLLGRKLRASRGHNENMLDDWHTKAGYGFYKGYGVQLFSF